MFVIESTLNSSNTPLLSGGTFTGIGELNGYADAMITVKSDTNGTFYADFSVDNINWDSTLSFKYNTSRINPPHILVKGHRYFRVRFVNEGENQSTFRINTVYGTFNKLTSPVNGTVSENYDATIVRPTDYQSEVAMGKRQGRTLVNNWGHNEALDANVEEIIAAWGGTFNPKTDIITTAQNITCTYTNTVDGLGTTGTLSVIISYLDGDFNLATYVHTLGNTGSDVIPINCLGINRVVVYSNGGLGWNSANITFRATIDGTTQAQIPAGGGTTDQIIYHTPINHNLLIDWVYINAIKLAGGSSPKISIKVYSWSRVTQTRYEIGHDKIDTSVTNTLDLKQKNPFPIGGREVVYLTAKSDTNGAEVETRLSGVLERII